MTIKHKTGSIIGKRCATLEEIQKAAQIIIDKFNPEKIILFGSYATDEATAESDVDLFIIVDSNKPSWELATEISLAIDHEFPLDIIVRSKQEVERRLLSGDFSIEDIIRKGKVLYDRSR